MHLKYDFFCCAVVCIPSYSTVLACSLSVEILLMSITASIAAMVLH